MPEADGVGVWRTQQTRHLSVLRGDEDDAPWMLCRVVGRRAMARAPAIEIHRRRRPAVVVTLFYGNRAADWQDDAEGRQRQISIEEDGAVDGRQTSELLADAAGLGHKRAVQELSER